MNLNRSRLSFVQSMKGGGFCKGMEPEHGGTGTWGFIGQNRELLGWNSQSAVPLLSDSNL